MVHRDAVHQVAAASADVLCGMLMDFLGSTTSGAAGGASAADPSPAHIAPATKGWGTPKNQAGLGQQEGGGRASRGRRGLSFGGIISGSSGS